MMMRRILLVMAAAALMVAMLAVPAFAQTLLEPGNSGAAHNCGPEVQAGLGFKNHG